MPEEIVMPRLSDTMERGTIVRWLKREGQEVSKGEVLAEIETDKATMPLESYAAGVLQRILLPEGGSAPIGTPIAVIARPGEAVAAPAAPTPAAAPSPAPSAAPSTPPPSPSAPAAPSAPPSGRILASPIARRLAEELNIDLSTIVGTGPGGRITKEDVEEAARARRAAPAPTPPPPAAPPVAPTPIARPLTRMQETIARRMVQSKTTIPHFYVTSEIDMAEATRLRQQLNQAWDGVHVGFTEMIVKAVALALKAYPEVNASWKDDHIEYHETVNVGLAVAVEHGLLVPVLHDVDRKDLRTLAVEVKDLVQRTRDGHSRPGDFEGGTFTVSNLGQYPVDEFLAIVNPPESAILAVGRIEKKPVVRDDTIVISERVRVSLSGDHRVFYGATAGAFLGELKRLLESPLSLLA
ncbi:MAG TPA: dihydrolipoamide acetyltransferase family protein [Chloroflexota bacterium]|nr:dihydrolipoamide acetyltransferase family protein [Chloroflexota bacterium]